MLNYNCSPGNFSGNFSFYYIVHICICPNRFICQYHQLNNFPRSNFFFLAMIRHIKEEEILILLKRNWGIYWYSLGEGREGRDVKGKNDLILHSETSFPVFLDLFSLNSLRWVYYSRVSEQRLRGVYILLLCFQLNLMGFKYSQ